MRNAAIVTCIIALVVIEVIFFPRGEKNETDDIKIEPPQTTKMQLKGKTIECELKNYTTDGRIGVTVHCVLSDTNSTVVSVFFKNITDTIQPLNLKDVFVEDRAKNILPLEDYEITWQTFNVLDKNLNSLGPKEGVRVNYYFKKSEKLLKYFAFRNVYYSSFEYTIWKVKIIY